MTIRRSHRFRVALAVLLAAPLLTGCISVNLLGSGQQPMVETVVHVSGPDGRKGAKLLLLEIDGFIGDGDSVSLLGSPPESTVPRLREQLDRAQQDDAIRGILLRVDSPGGSATASDIVYQELARFTESRGLPLVAHFYGTAASGGYYVAMAADEIVAEPTAVTGSIGVIFASVNFSGLMERWGIEDQTVTSGPRKDTGSMIRPQTDEDRAILQGVIDDLHARFREVVEAGRPALGAERVAELADGRIYSAPQALENGLVDRIGGIEDAVGALEARVGANASWVVSYHRPREWRQNLHSKVDAAAPATGPGALRPLAPGFLYLWAGAAPLPSLPLPIEALIRTAPGASLDAALDGSSDHEETGAR